MTQILLARGRDRRDRGARRCSGSGAEGSRHRVEPGRTVNVMLYKVEHPDIRHVVYPVHMDGTLTGAQPRLRHYPDCTHFEWRDGLRLGTPIPATDEQMRTLRACQSCVSSRGGSSGSSQATARDTRTREVCPTCCEVLPLTGRCDNCDG